MTPDVACFVEEPRVAVEARPRGYDLWQRYAQHGHGSAAEEELIRQHLPLVKTVAGRVAMGLPPHVDSEDLFSAGLVGLLNAVRRYDAESGTSFETYARILIRGAVFDELRRLDWVPRSVHDKARKVEEATRRLEQEKGDLPTPAEVSRALGLTLDEYEELLDEIRPATFVCLDSVRAAEHDDGANQSEFIADSRQPDPGDGAARRELARLIAERIEQLPDMQKKVLALYYFEDLRLREIAEVFGVTESRICQIHSQAILNIRSHLRQREETPGQP
ncbi:MAG: FliA/WhiG family RNA polymerase sigma factor [Verrucomicrobia bacterium]|nr:FliA/WhiG family RNA polymerase sigma factor [Verrucomicrobiota bacterium]